MRAHPQLTPWPVEDGSRDDGLDLSVKIESPLGWVDLEDGVNYAIHGESFAARQVTWRKREANAPWIEGTFPLSAVRDNVNEALVVMVRGDTHLEFRQKMYALTDALEQLTYALMVRMDDAVEYWQCFPADYSIETQKEFLHARLGLVRATVPRLPAVTLVPSTADEV